MAFDVITPIQLFQAAVLVADTEQYVAPALTVVIIPKGGIVISNTTAASVDVSLSAGPGGLAASSILSAVPIPANGVFVLPGIINLNAADTIRTAASAVGLVMTVSGGAAV